MLRAMGVALLLMIVLIDGARPARVLASQSPIVPPVADDQWVALGPVDIDVRALAVSPDWPTDRFIYIVGDDRTQRANRDVDPPQLARRTYDGGGTWETLPSPPQRLQSVRITLTPGSGRVMLGFPDSGTSQTPSALLRSADDGQTWVPIFPARGNRVPSPTLSPSFATDQLALVIDGESLLRSTDLGIRWEPLASWPGWRIHQVVFSPNFSDDQTLFVSASAGGFRSIITPPDEPQSLQAAIQGSGDLLKSTDGGKTWTSASAGLELDGAPYRHIQALAISLTFAQDQTLLAYAWGRGQPTSTSVPTPSVRPALFASTDGGASWRFLWEPFPPDQWRPNSYGLEYNVRPYSLVMSPQFAANGVALMPVHTQGASPHNGYCHLYRTSDFGATWSISMPLFPQPGAPYSCAGLTFAGPDGRSVFWKGTAGGYWWSRSLDGGATMQTLHGGGPQEFEIAFLSDGTVIEPWLGTLRMLPPGAGAPSP